MGLDVFRARLQVSPWAVGAIGFMISTRFTSCGLWVRFMQLFPPKGLSPLKLSNVFGRQKNARNLAKDPGVLEGEKTKELMDRG